MWAHVDRITEEEVVVQKCEKCNRSTLRLDSTGAIVAKDTWKHNKSNIKLLNCQKLDH